jgi:hypothetical protein
LLAIARVADVFIEGATTDPPAPALALLAATARFLRPGRLTVAVFVPVRAAHLAVDSGDRTALPTQHSCGADHSREQTARLPAPGRRKRAHGPALTRPARSRGWAGQGVRPSRGYLVALDALLGCRC